ncbi:MAG: YceI family protein [Labilithrix sp.]|nr:YceI family protein [Labilithrix sp.]
MRSSRRLAVTRSSRWLAVTALAVHVGCGGASSQRAALGPAAAAVGAPAPARPLEILPAARVYEVDPSRSRFELYGMDVLGGEHMGTFGAWRARIEIAPMPRIAATVDTGSIEMAMAGATGILKSYLLETHRYPTATLAATLRRTDGVPEEHVVEGTATLHGVAQAIRFFGRLTPEDDGFRFTTDFVLSRKAFDIRYTPLEPLLRDDVRIVLDAFARPALEDASARPASEDASAPPRPAEAPAPVPSTWYTPPP